MNLLFCTHRAVTKTLGAPKALIELADALRSIGWAVDIAGPDEICPAGGGHAAFREGLCAYLQANADRYDVIDYEHEDLPFARSLFSPRSLLVARAALLVHHLEMIAIPGPSGLRSIVGRILYGQGRKQALKTNMALATRTVQEADLVNVSNPDDKRELLRRGLPAAKIAILHLGLAPSARGMLEAIPAAVPAEPPTIAFVGSFDYRKGAAEFPRIVSAVLKSVPDARFRLIGTKGLFPDNDSVLRLFPSRIRHHIAVVPEFQPESLAELLNGSWIGMFPSHVEGFGFGVLEMLTAACPVIAYDVPGPPVMLPAEWLVARGDAGSMAAKIVSMLQNHRALAAARLEARERSGPFRCETVARQTADVYRQHLLLRRQSATLEAVPQ